MKEAARELKREQYSNVRRKKKERSVKELYKGIRGVDGDKREMVEEAQRSVEQAEKEVEEVRKRIEGEIEVEREVRKRVETQLTKE